MHVVYPKLAQQLKQHVLWEIDNSAV